MSPIPAPRGHSLLCKDTPSQTSVALGVTVPGGIPILAPRVELGIGAYRFARGVIYPFLLVEYAGAPVHLRLPISGQIGRGWCRVVVETAEHLRGVRWSVSRTGTFVRRGWLDGAGAGTGAGAGVVFEIANAGNQTGSHATRATTAAGSLPLLGSALYVGEKCDDADE